VFQDPEDAVTWNVHWPEVVQGVKYAPNEMTGSAAPAGGVCRYEAP
jgi:hypothetical protein